MKVDPACGMIIDESNAGDAAMYGDRRYFFCSAECRTAFVRNPEGYLKDAPDDGRPSPTPAEEDLGR